MRTFEIFGSLREITRQIEILDALLRHACRRDIDLNNHLPGCTIQYTLFIEGIPEKMTINQIVRLCFQKAVHQLSKFLIGLENRFERLHRRNAVSFA